MIEIHINHLAKTIYYINSKEKTKKNLLSLKSCHCFVVLAPCRIVASYNGSLLRQNDVFLLGTFYSNAYGD
jgi:hypothetical protein